MRFANRQLWKHPRLTFGKMHLVLSEEWLCDGCVWPYFDYGSEQNCMCITSLLKESNLVCFNKKILPADSEGITNKSKMAACVHTCQQIGAKITGATLDHKRNIPVKFLKNTPRGL